MLVKGALLLRSQGMPSDVQHLQDIKYVTMTLDATETDGHLVQKPELIVSRTSTRVKYSPTNRMRTSGVFMSIETFAFQVFVSEYIVMYEWLYPKFSDCTIEVLE